MIWKGASCWDVDPGLLHSKSMCQITTPQCLSGYYLLQPLLEDLAYDSQLCLFHKDAQAAKWAVAKNSSQCRASQLQDWAHAVCEGQSPGAVLSAAERAAVTQIAVLGGRRYRGLRHCVESVPEPEDSSLVLPWIFGYFWSLPRGVRSPSPPAFYLSQHQGLFK